MLLNTELDFEKKKKKKKTFWHIFIWDSSISIYSTHHKHIKSHKTILLGFTLRESAARLDLNIFQLSFYDFPSHEPRDKA